MCFFLFQCAYLDITLVIIHMCGGKIINMHRCSAPQTWILEEGLGSCVKDELSKSTDPKSEAATLMSLSSKLRGHCDLPPRVSTLAVDGEVVRAKLPQLQKGWIQPRR